MRPEEQSPETPWFWPVLGAAGLHLVLFGLLFVSFSATPDLPPARPVVEVTFYELKSRSKAESQTQQKIAGEAQKTAAREAEMEQLRLRKAEEQKKAEAARKAEAERKAAEQKRQAEIAARKKAEEEEKKKKAAEEARKKAEQEKARKAAEEAARKKAEEEAALKALEERRAQALKELLAEDLERQAALAEEASEEEATGNIDDLLRLRAAQGWSRPPSARPSMTVVLRVAMLPDGTITSVNVATSSGDVPFDNSAVAAVRNIGRITEVQSLTPQQFQRYRSFLMTFTPEDLAL
jgi:colicin import membrane protein